MLCADPATSSDRDPDTVEGVKGAGLREVTGCDNGHIQSVSDVGEGGEGRAQDCGIVLGSGRQEQVEGIEKNEARATHGGDRLAKNGDVVREEERGRGRGNRLRGGEERLENRGDAGKAAEVSEVGAGGEEAREERIGGTVFGADEQDTGGVGRGGGVRPGDGGRGAGGEVGEEEGFADAGVADEQSQRAAGDIARPQPGARLRRNMPGVAEHGVKLRADLNGLAVAVEVVAGGHAGGLRAGAVQALALESVDARERGDDGAGMDWRRVRDKGKGWRSLESMARMGPALPRASFPRLVALLRGPIGLP